MADTSETAKEAYRKIKDEGLDVSLRRRVAAELVESPLTNHELADLIEDHSGNSLQPRVNELVRMGCVERDGKRTNPSGHEAFVNHLTPTGERYVAGEIDPEPSPPLSELKRNVVDTTRDFLLGDAEEGDVRMALMAHDDMKRQLNPDWEP